MKKHNAHFTWLVFILLHFAGAQAQPSDSSSLHPGRAWIVGGGHAVTWAGSFIALNKAWYAGYPRSGFHTYNDMSEWQQMDKAGHTWTTYQVSRLSGSVWKWAGFPRNKAAILGAVSGMAYQSIIEIQDGFSEEWGFSWGDMGANLVGAAAFAAQEIGWKEQKISIKFSYNGYQYPNGTIDRRNDLFGKTLPERLLKDYNAQTYWISAPVSLAIPALKKLPWLNLALGYRAEGMLGGYENVWEDENGMSVQRMDIKRSRGIILSPDIDFTRIPSRKKWVKSLLFVANAVKFPFPGLEWNNDKGWRFGL